MFCGGICGHELLAEVFRRRACNDPLAAHFGEMVVQVLREYHLSAVRARDLQCVKDFFAAAIPQFVLKTPSAHWTCLNLNQIRGVEIVKNLHLDVTTRRNEQKENV